MPVVTLGRVLDAEWVGGWAEDLVVAQGADQVGGSVVGLAGGKDEGSAVAEAAELAGEIAK